LVCSRSTWSFENSRGLSAAPGANGVSTDLVVPRPSARQRFRRKLVKRGSIRYANMPLSLVHHNEARSGIRFLPTDLQVEGRSQLSPVGSRQMGAGS
jgi:hypothetical protein